MRLDARELEAEATIDCDVCIVGAGAAGIALARALKDSGLDVCLLESGGLEADPQTQDLYDGESVGLDYDKLTSCRLRIFGGTTEHWTGYCRPLEAADMQANDWMPRPGWPVAHDALQAHYERAHVDLELGAFDYDPVTAAEQAEWPLLPFDAARARSVVYRLSGPTRFGQAYRDELFDAQDVRVYLFANAIELVLAKGADRVETLRCGTLTGVDFSVSATRYVLAMGGIENARFLLASRTQVDAGVANSSGLVGRAFMEHPHIYNAVYLLTDGRLDLRFYAQTLRKLDGTDGTGETSGPEARGRGAFALSQTLTTREELPAVACRLREADLDTVEEDATTGDIAPSEIAALLRSAPTELDLYSLEIRSEQRPLAKSRVSLSDERDAFGMPRTKLSWQVDPDDLRRIGRALEILGAELARVGAGRLWLPQDDSGAFDPPRILGGCHHMGTTPMGDDAATSVVDQNCRTHDVDNLYLAGSSVFPSTGFANPTLTIVALAHRLAEHLRSEA